MPLTLAQLEGIQADLLADDIEIDFEKMSLWTEEQATAYFESGGTEEPKAGPALPPMAPQMPQVSAEEFKKWFPKAFFQGEKMYKQPPAFRMVCFHPAGCSESVWSGNGLRQKEPNPFVAHCKAKGGELLACELPGREQRRNDPRSATLGPYVEQLFPVLAPVLQDGTPYVICCHSMGTWMMYEFVKKLVTAGIPLPKQLVISAFPSPDIPFKDRPWPQCRKQDDEAFKDNCRGWDVNDIALIPSNFATFSPMFRDDFMLFDEYEYVPLPECVSGGLPIPIQCYYAIDDKRVKKAHMEGWKKFTSEKCDVYEASGHHLFFFDVPARAKYMQDAISRLPF